MKPVGLALLVAFAAATTIAPAQTVTVDANDAINAIDMHNLINDGEQLQQQRFGYMMQHPERFGGGGGVAVSSGPRPLSPSEMAALMPKLMELGYFQYDPTATKTLVHNLAERTARNPNTRTSNEQLFGSLIEQWHTAIQKISKTKETYLQTGYYGLYLTAYSIVHPGTVLSQREFANTGETFKHLVVLQQVQRGRAFSDQERQRTYDTLGVIAMTLQRSQDAASQRGDAALADKVQEQSAAVLEKLVGVKAGSSPSATSAAMDALGNRAAYVIALMHSKVMALH